MNWKNNLATFEDNKQWDSAIAYMQDVVLENSDNMDVYLAINYLLVHVLTHEDYDATNHDYYTRLLRRYLKESYKKFFDNPEYLFFTAMTVAISPNRCDVQYDDRRAMLKKARQMDKDNILYEWGYSGSGMNSIGYKQLSKEVLENDSVIKALESRGSLGRYVLDVITSWTVDTKRDTLCALLDKYVSNKIDSKTFCHTCHEDLGDELLGQELRLFNELCISVAGYIEFEKEDIAGYEKGTFSEAELRQKAVELHNLLRASNLRPFRHNN